VAATAGVLIFAVNLMHALADMRDDLPQWGFDRADVRLIRSGKRATLEHQALLQRIAAEPGVRAVLATDFVVDGALPARAGQPVRQLLGTAVDGDFAAAGYAILAGRNPQRPDEVALASNTAAAIQAAVGAPLELFLHGTPVRLTVVGVYQSAQNLGQGFRIQSAALRAIDPLYQPTMYAVMLAPDVDRDAFIQRLEARYGEALDAQPGEAFVAPAIANIVGSIGLALGLVVLVFALVCAVAIYNSTRMDVAEQRRSLGILKTLGLTPRQLRWIQVTKASLLAIAGSAIGGLLWLLLIRPLLERLFGTVGLVRFPLQQTALGTALLLPALVLLCGVAGWCAARRSSRLDVRTLVVE